MKRSIIILFAVMLSSAAFAQTTDLRVAATSEAALAFSRIGHSPAAEAMGGAGLLSTSSFAWSSYYNPAAVPFAHKTADFAVSYNTWRPSSSNYINLGGSYKIGDKVGITAGATLGMGKTMELRDEFGSEAGHFRPMDYQFNLGAAYRFVEWVSVGANVKYVAQKLFTDVRQGTVAADVFFMGEYNGIKATVGFNSLGGRVKDLAGRRWNIPSSLSFAAGYETVLWGAHGIEAEVRGDYYFIEDRAVVNNPFCLSMGAAYSFKFITARLGYHYGAESSVMPSFGAAGITLRIADIHIDAMYYIAKEGSPLKNNLSFGLGYSF